MNDTLLFYAIITFVMVVAAGLLAARDACRARRHTADHKKIAESYRAQTEGWAKRALDAEGKSTQRKQQLDIIVAAYANERAEKDQHLADARAAITELQRQVRRMSER